MSLLGSPVGGRHAGHAQKGEQVRALPGQAVQQSAVRRVADRPGHEPVHRGLQHRHLSAQRAAAKLAASRPSCSMLKQAGQRVRGLGLPGDRVADELVAAPQRVRQVSRVKRKALRPRPVGP
jgi:hypothetical protein